MLFLLSTALAIASAFLPQSNALMVCNGTVGGKFYDLSPLHALGDTKITPMSGAYDYYVNVCGSVGGPCANRSAFACQVRKSPADQFESVVAYSDVESHSPAPAWGPSASETGGVKLVFTNGDSCNLRQRFNIVYPTKVVCAAPTTEAPTTKAPTTEAPTTKAPTTEAPTHAPTTEAPTHAPNGTTTVPTTEAPTHAPNGTTTVPTTEAPTHAPNGTTTVPTTYAPTVLPTTQAPTTAAPTTHAPTSTPSASSSTTYDENSITRAGVGVGIGVGIGILALVWLLWCCYDRSRTQRVQVDSGYATLTSSSV